MPAKAAAPGFIAIIICIIWNGDMFASALFGFGLGGCPVPPPPPAPIMPPVLPAWAWACAMAAAAWAARFTFAFVSCTLISIGPAAGSILPALLPSLAA